MDEVDAATPAPDATDAAAFDPAAFDPAAFDPEAEPGATIEPVPLEEEPEFIAEQASVVLAPRDGIAEDEDLVDPEASGGDRDDPWEDQQ